MLWLVRGCSVVLHGHPDPLQPRVHAPLHHRVRTQTILIRTQGNSTYIHQNNTFLFAFQ